VPASAFKWIHAESPAKAFRRGDVIELETSANEAGKVETFVSQEPIVEGAAVIL
jgi:hypothetical protein